MVLPISIVGAIIVVALIGGAFARGQHRKRADLGAVSDGWIAQHRVSWYDEQR
jgi:hypothetical protein